MMYIKECPHTGLKCSLDYKCSECFLTDVWCNQAREYIINMYELNFPQVEEAQASDDSTSPDQINFEL